MPRFAIVANSKAGGCQAASKAQVVHDLLRQHGAFSRLYCTSSHTDLQHLVKLALQENTVEFQEPLCIVVCGGDGSIQEVINCLLSDSAREAVIGLAPAGTCNDFASALGIHSDPKQIAEVLLHGQVRRIDLGLAGNRYFCTIATVGFESTVNRYLKYFSYSSPSRWMFVAAAFVALLTHRSIWARVVIDGEAVELDMLSLIVANTACYGGRIRIAPAADPRDGNFQVGMFANRPILQKYSLLRAALDGQHLRHPGVIFKPAVQATISTKRPTQVWADGELIGSTPVDMTLIPGALGIIVPAETSFQ